MVKNEDGLSFQFFIQSFNLPADLHTEGMKAGQSTCLCVENLRQILLLFDQVQF